MRSCPRCGAENPSEHKFCAGCGLMLTSAPAPAGDDAPGWLGVDDSAATKAPLLDKSWMPTSPARPAAAVDDVPEWLRRDEHLAHTAPAAEAGSAGGEQRPEELPDWLREITDESRQRMEARAHESAPVPSEEPQPAAPATLAHSDDLPDWLREIAAEAHTPDQAAPPNGDAQAPTDKNVQHAGDTEGHIVAGVEDSPPWLREEPLREAAATPRQVQVAEAEVVEAEVVEATARPEEHTAASFEPGANTVPPVPDTSWRIDETPASATAIPSLAPREEETRARVYDIPADSIWSVQPDRPAPDGSTGQQTAVWGVPDQTATEIVPRSTEFELPRWLVDDDIEPAPTVPARAWSPPSWLEDADLDVPPVRQQSATWTPPSWLEGDGEAPATARGSRTASWLDDDGGGVAVAGSGAVTATATLAQPVTRPAEGQSAELLQRLLTEPAPEGPAALPGRPEPAPAAAPSRGGGTMMLVIVVVLLVLLALAAILVAPSFGINLF